MDQNRVVASHIVLELADGLQKGLALDISYGSPDFDNGNPILVHAFSTVKTAFNLIVI